MHGNQWVLKIAVLKYYSVQYYSTAKSNPNEATDPISLHTKFGDNSSNTFPLNERKPCVTPDIGHRTPDGRKSKNNISTPQGGGHNSLNEDCNQHYYARYFGTVFSAFHCQGIKYFSKPGKVFGL